MDGLRLAGVVERRRMRDFIFRHLYLVNEREQDLLVLRYGIVGYYGISEFSDIADILRGEGDEDAADRVRRVHDVALRRIAHFTVDAELPLLMRVPVDEMDGMKEKARRIARRAVKAGKLVRKPCERCGSQKSQMHHPNYQHPLQVKWLCQQHHSEEHSRKAEAARARGATW